MSSVISSILELVSSSLRFSFNFTLSSFIFSSSSTSVSFTSSIIDLLVSISLLSFVIFSISLFIFLIFSDISSTFSLKALISFSFTAILSFSSYISFKILLCSFSFKIYSAFLSSNSLFVSSAFLSKETISFSNFVISSFLPKIFDTFLLYPPVILPVLAKSSPFNVTTFIPLIFLVTDIAISIFSTINVLSKNTDIIPKYFSLTFTISFGKYTCFSISLISLSLYIIPFL